MSKRKSEIGIVSSSLGPRMKPTRTTERRGIRAVTDFFETNHCVVQPVNNENDFGKDLYIDFSRDRQVTGITCAVQVKTGVSYRSKDGHFMPVGQHLGCWRDSTVPVIGIVFDAARKQMTWINITQYLRNSDDRVTRIQIPGTQRLTRNTLPQLELSIRKTTGGDHPLVGLWSTDPHDVENAILDCLGIGRKDPRVFMALRASTLLLHEDCLPTLIYALSGFTEDAEHSWQHGSWFDSSLATSVCSTYRWSVPEVIRLSRAADGEWHRGTIGQNVELLLREDPQIRDTLLEAVEACYETKLDEAWILFCLYVHFFGDNADRAFNRKIRSFPKFKQHPGFPGVAEYVSEHGALPVGQE
jgi:hypothetical protein